MSDFYNKYPYTDFHELNLDWMIKRVKKLTEDWLATQEAWNNTQEQWQQLYDYVHDYFANLDVQDEINNKINQMILDGTFMTIVTPTINQTVVDATTTWLAAHITQPTTPAIDNTLSIAGAAADAKAAGDAIAAVDAKIPVNEMMAYKGQATGTTIASNYAPGWFSVDSAIVGNFTDLPSGASIGTILNISRGGNSSINNVDQYYIEALTAKIWKRYVINGNAYDSWTLYITETIMQSDAISYRGAATGTTCASNFRTGWYTIDSSIVGNFTDLPTGASVGIILNVSRGGNVSINNVNQYYINALDHKIWERYVTNGTAYNSWEYHVLGSAFDSYKADALSYRGIVSGTTLVSNLAIGWYAIGTSELPNLTDLPENAEIGNLINISHAGNTSPNLIKQIYINALNGRSWSRLIASGVVFRDWDTEAGSYDIKWYAVGDSITAGVYSTNDGQTVTEYNPPWAYPNRIASMYKCEVHNLGNPGKAITEFGSIISGISSDANLVTITGGANDYANQTKPLGDVSSTIDYNTVCGALKSIIETVAANAVNARIVLISPFPIYRYGDASTKYSINYAYAAGGNFTYAELAEAMKDIADLYGVEFIDGTNNGPINMVNISDVEKDDVHPTLPFYLTISNWLGSKLF